MIAYAILKFVSIEVPIEPVSTLKISPFLSPHLKERIHASTQLEDLDIRIKKTEHLFPLNALNFATEWADLKRKQYWADCGAARERGDEVNFNLALEDYDLMTVVVKSAQRAEFDPLKKAIEYQANDYQELAKKLLSGLDHEPSVYQLGRRNELIDLSDRYTHIASFIPS